MFGRICEIIARVFGFCEKSCKVQKVQGIFGLEVALERDLRNFKGLCVALHSVFEADLDLGFGSEI